MLRAARRAFSSGPGFEVLHRSRIPTLHFQDSLPKLPLPALSDTLERMLYSAAPIMPPTELEEIRVLAAEFAAGEGPALQEALLARDAAAYSSYISEPWFELYLRDQRSLLLNYNPQLTFKDEEGPGRSTQTGRAARLVHGATTFLRTLESGALEPDVFHTAPAKSKTRLFEEVVRLLPRKVSFYGAAACGAYPLDMSQYANLFRSTRLPHATRDTLVVAEGPVRHIVVQRGGRFWSVDVLTADGASVPLAQLQGALEAVVAEADAAPAPADERLGLLTTLPRDEWASQRGALEAEAGGANAASLQAVDSALFALSLDACAPEGTDEVCRAFLHGDGIDRWLDKSFQLIVSANGKAAVNFEHAWGDGVAVLRFFNEVHAASGALPALEASAAPAAPPASLRWAVPAGVKAAVADAADRFAATIGRTELATQRTELMNSQVLKQAKLSPDGVMQMAFQLAHATMHGGPLPSTYESASTAAFKHGRTETIRSATPEAAAFTAAFLDASAGGAERAAAMRAAVANHGRITRDALMGKGMDRHLFALADAAAAQGLAPALFSCAGYKTLGKIILSTSTLSSEALDNGGFGPVNDECYAIGYGIRSYGAEARVMSYGRDSAGFVDCLDKAMLAMVEAAKVEV